MADIMAIVSKAIFEKAAGKAPKVGTALRMDRYVSANKALEPLAQGGKLYLVTVRPPDEALWLVAILEKPELDGVLVGGPDERRRSQHPDSRRGHGGRLHEVPTAHSRRGRLLGSGRLWQILKFDVWV